MFSTKEHDERSDVQGEQTIAKYTDALKERNLAAEQLSVYSDDARA